MSVKEPQIDFGEELGAGTTGFVMRGTLREPYEDLPAGTQVAVKRLHADPEDAALSALAREVDVLAAIRGAARLPQLVFASGGTHPMLVTRFLPGPCLRDVIDAGPLVEPRARRLAEDLAEGLAALHDAGWWHGDVKPENVRLDGRDSAVLLDLGFAQPIERSQDPASGSLPYLAPERCAGVPGGPPADLFALGLILAEMATGSLPLAPREDERHLPDAWLQTRSEAAAYVPSSLDPRLSPLFDLVVADLLHPDPDRRPVAAETAARLRAGEAGPWWRSVLVKGIAQRWDPRARLETGRLPFAGRESELRQLEDAFRAASAGAGRAVWLEGEEGSGKSRLMAEFVARARHTASPPVYLDGRCSEFPDERPGQPLRSLVRRWLGLQRHSPVGERERGVLREVAGKEVVAVLERALDPDDADPPGDEGEALALCLAALASKQPVVVFLDDLTFADAVTFDGLSRLADRLVETQLLLVVGLRWGRPATHPVLLENFRARIATRAPSLNLSLGPLARSHVLALVQLLFHHSSPQLRLARVLHERSEGSPGVIAELLRTMEQRRMLRRHRAGRGLLELLVPPEEVPVPGSASRLIEERYGLLDARQQRWLRRLAAVGNNLEPGFLSRAFPELDAPGALAILEEQRGSGWLVPSDGLHSFARSRQREFLYEQLSSEERAEAHRGAASALAYEGVRDREYQQAYHLQAAGDTGPLLDVALPLVRRLRSQGHPERILTLAGWCLAALDEGEEHEHVEQQRMELLEASADAADRLGRRDVQRQALDRLADLELDPDAEPEAVGRVYLLHGRYSANTGLYGPARGMLHNAALLFRKAKQPELESDALQRLAHVQGHVGQLEEAGRLARRALDLTSDMVRKARCQLALAVVSIVGDNFEEALRRIDRAAGPLRQLDDPTGGRGALAAAYLLRARTYRLVGRPRRAFAAIHRAARHAAHAGERRLAAETAARHGRLLLDVDRTQEAELVLREAVFACQEIEYKRGQALATVFLGTLLAEAGDSEALGMLERNTRLAQQMGLGRVEALNLTLRARLARQGGAGPAAHELAEQALGIFERFSGELADRIVIVGTAALLRRDVGNVAGAREIEGQLRRRVRRVNERILSPILRQRHHRAMSSLMRAALSPEGPVYPRVAIADLPDGAGTHDSIA